MLLDEVTVKVDNVRIVFPRLFPGEEKAFNNVGDKYWQASFLIEPTDPQIKDIQQAIVNAVGKKDEFKSDVSGSIKAFKLKDKLPLHDGDTKATKKYGATFVGKLYISARNNANSRNVIVPIVYDNVKAPGAKSPNVITDPRHPHAPYSGSYVNVALNLFAYNAGGGQGVGAAIVAVQFAKDGERLSGSSMVNPDAFEAIPQTEGESSSASVDDPFA